MSHPCDGLLKNGSFIGGSISNALTSGFNSAFGARAGALTPVGRSTYTKGPFSPGAPVGIGSGAINTGVDNVPAFTIPL